MADTFIVIGTGPAVNVVLGGAGASAYQIWLDAGNTGTEQDFLDSLVGADGSDGATGATGPQGPPGEDAAAGIDGSGTAGQLAVFVDSDTIGGDADLTWDSSTNTLIAGSSTALNSAYKLQVAGNATYRNAAFTTNETNNGFLDIRGGTMTAASGSTHALAGINVEGAMVFSASNQTLNGIRVALTSNATASQFVNPLNISVSAATEATSELANTNASGSSVLKIGATSSSLIMKSPNAGSGGGARPGYNYINAGGSPFAWNLEGSASNGFFVRSVTGSSNPGGVDPTFFVKDDKVSIGRYPFPAFPATLSVKNSTGYGQLNLATTYTPSSSADALGSNGDVAYDANYIYVKVGGSWKRSALSTF